MSTYQQPAHHTPTTPIGGTDTPQKISSASAGSSAAVALSMSWQLLVVIILPIVGGHLLDGKYNTSPTWTIIGMVIGVAGTIVVVRQAMRQLSDIMNRNTTNQDSTSRNIKESK
jgi:F0F1-type ATP synthase assembly protein I